MTSTTTPVPLPEDLAYIHHRVSQIAQGLGVRKFDADQGSVIDGEDVTAEMVRLATSYALRYDGTFGYLVAMKAKAATRNGLSGRMAVGVLNCVLAEVRRLAEAKIERKNPPADVAAGRYAIELEGRLVFVKVDRPTDGRWAGQTFVKPQRSDYFGERFDRVTRNQVLALIATDPQAAMARYGKELGHCGACGRTLTDETSRQRGIGPDCYARLGFSDDPRPVSVPTGPVQMMDTPWFTTAGFATELTGL